MTTATIADVEATEALIAALDAVVATAATAKTALDAACAETRRFHGSDECLVESDALVAFFNAVAAVQPSIEVLITSVEADIAG